MTTVRKARVTEEHREEARRLRAIWDATPHDTQAVFGEKYGIGNQSSVGQFLHGTVPLSMKAASGFATGLGCSVADFSPRLDGKIKALSDGMSHAMDTLKRIQGDEDRLTGQQHQFYYTPVVGRDEHGNVPETIWANRVVPEGDTGEFVAIGKSETFCFAIEVQGLSMVPRFRPGEYVVVEPQTPLNIEDDVLLRLKSGKALLRRLASDPAAEVLQFTNYSDASVLAVPRNEVTWLYHVAHGIPRKKVVRL